MATSSLPPGITIEFARVMKLSWIIDTGTGSRCPRDAEAYDHEGSSAVGIQRATNGLDVSTMGTAGS